MSTGPGLPHQLDKSYWQQRWQQGQTGWDIGDISPALQHYFDQLADPNVRILIPGAGNAYEAEYLWRKGFGNVVVVDIAPAAIAAFRRRLPGFPAAQAICCDFFNHQGCYDLIVEHTFFCALHPSLRGHYVRHMHRLLAPNGCLVGLLFDDPMTDVCGPPFGGTYDEYYNLFQDYFEIITLKRTDLSIAPRMGRELFMELRKT